MSKQTIYVLILTLITVIAWVSFEVYHQSKKTTLPEVVQEQVTPLDPNLKTEILEELRIKQENVVGESLPF